MTFSSPARTVSKAYRLLFSPILHTLAGPGWGCRFYPTCSHFAELAVEQRGWFRGGALALKRLLKCHPLSRKAGFDPVPSKE